MDAYQHKDSDYFRLGKCNNCGQGSFHKPIEYKRKSGRIETFWECEYCHFEVLILDPMDDEFERIGAFVKSMIKKK